MKKSTLVWLLGILLLVTSCSKKSTNPEEKPPEDYTLQASQTISSEGGTLSIDDFSLKVPAGAFSSDAELKLYASSDDRPFGDNCVTRAFLLEGLPDEFSQPLHLCIKYQDTLSYESFIAIGEEVVGSISGLSIGYDLLSATDSSSYLVCDIPVPEVVSRLSGGDRSENHTALKPCGSDFWSCIGVSGYSTHDTTHFKIEYPKDQGFEAPAQNLGSYLEAAYDTLKKMGYQHVVWRKSPVKVKIRDLKDDNLWGEFVFDIRKNKEENFLRFNSTKMIDDEKIKVTAGHEFFHLVQNLYDPRNNAEIDKDNKYEWLDEATAVWSEEMYSSDPGNYVSGVFGENFMEPFYGMQVCPPPEGQTGKPDVHGYGMAAVIKYLTQQDGDSLVLKIYNRVKQLEHPAMALIKSVKNPPEVWWPDFFREYVSGNIYSQKPADFWYTMRNQWTIKKDTDTLLTRPNQEYHDLSAKLWRINLQYPNMPRSARLRCAVTGTDLRPVILVFKYTNAGDLVPLDYDADSVIVPGLRTLKDEGSHLLIVPINSKYHDPYSTALRDGQMTIRVLKESAYDCSFLLQFDGEVKTDFSDPTKPDTTYSLLLEIYAINIPGALTDSTYEASWDTRNDPGPGYNDMGTISLTLSTDYNLLREFKLSQTIETPTSTQDIVLTAANIQADSPPSDPYDFLPYSIDGTQICSHLSISKFEVRHTNGDLTTLLKPNCDPSDLLQIGLWKHKGD
jgi:hypothetical protein